MSGTKEILNSEEVEFLLEATSTDDTAGDATEPGSQQSITMRGDLEQMHLADIFQTLSLAKMEGLLKVSNPVEQRMVHFQGGSVRILVPTRSVTRRLGQRLVQAGVLTSDQLRFALLEQRKNPAPLGEILVANGDVPQQQIDELVAVQITEELVGLFTWEHGDFEFYRGPVAEPALIELLEACPEFEINSLLLEVARRADEWEDILESLRSLDEIPLPCQVDVDVRQLGEDHQAMLLAVDGRLSYRELSQISVMSVFDCARAARDLIREGLISSCDDEHMLEVAHWHHEQGDAKKALMVALTLRDRQGDLSIAIVRQLAEIVRKVGEPQLACRVVLEAAQLQTDAELALELVQEARALHPRDLGALSFLRTTMLAHMAHDSPEVEQVSIELLDGLLHDGDTDRVLSLVAEISHLGATSPAILVRHARALTKRKENTAAVDVLLQAGRTYGEAGDSKRRLEVYELASRIDRDRKDVDKLIRQLRATPSARMARWGSILATLLILAVAGSAWYFSIVHKDHMLVATSEVGDLLTNGNYEAARTTLSQWRDRLGPCTAIEDLEQQLRFARAAKEKRRRESALRLAATRLQAAGALVKAGSLSEAFAIYAAMRSYPELTEKVDDSALTRLDALSNELEDLSNELSGNLPEPPDALSEQSYVETTLEKLRELVPEHVLAAARALVEHTGRQTLPAALPSDRRQALSATAERAIALMERAMTLTAAFEAATTRFEKQRRLDPLFQTALEHERRLEFPQALAAYRQLNEARAGSADLHAHLQSKIHELEGITGLCQAIAAATAAGDFATASREYQTLCRADTETPFAEFVRLPVTIRSSMPGAAIRWDDADAGHTPRLVSYRPDTSHSLELQLPRFRTAKLQLPGDHGGQLEVVLTLEPGLELQFEAGIDRPMQVDADDRVFATLSSGSVLAIDTRRAELLWQSHTPDIGNVSGPVLHGDTVITSSLDGPLRALKAATGEQIWRRDGLPTESSPVPVQGQLAVATVSGELVLISPGSGEELKRSRLPAATRNELMTDGQLLFAALDDGTNIAIDVKRQQPVWRSDPHDQGQQLLVTPLGLIALRDDGQLLLIRGSDGAVRWRRQLPATPVGRLAANRSAVLVTLDSHVQMLDLRTGQPLWSAQRAGNSWAGPAVFLGSRVAAPTRDGAILIFGNGDQRARYRLDGNRGAAMIGAGTRFGVVSTGRNLRLYRQLP